jgi:hypothetical protein
MRQAYPANFGEEFEGGVTVTFPGVQEAITRAGTDRRP